MNLNTGILYEKPIEGFAIFAIMFAVLFTAYLLGSINSAILISKVIYRDDIRKHGSGNGGMTNMLRTFGGKAAILTLVGDLLKTAIAVFIAGLVYGFWYTAGIATSEMCYMAGLFAVLGHIFPLYYRFKGGKGVLVTSTMALILTPVPFLILLAIFVAIVYMSRYVSLGSVSVAVLYPVLLHGAFAVVFEAPMPGLMALSTIVLACLIVWCHRENLKRISEGTESKLSFKKKKDE